MVHWAIVGVDIPLTQASFRIAKRSNGGALSGLARRPRTVTNRPRSAQNRGRSVDCCSVNVFGLVLILSRRALACSQRARTRFDRSEGGASLVEYALLVGLIAVVCIGAVSFLGGNAQGKFSSIGSSIQ
jgi:pilus assembly protein Flp/PilA